MLLSILGVKKMHCNQWLPRVRVIKGSAREFLCDDGTILYLDGERTYCI